MKRSSRASGSVLRAGAEARAGSVAIAIALGLALAPALAAAAAPAAVAGPSGPTATIPPTIATVADTVPVDLVPRSEAEGLPIARIEIDARNIFDPLPGGRFNGVFRLANRLHVRTRARTVREQLLFEPGDRWSEAEGHETARNLRELRYLTPQHIVARRQGDSAVVRVETRDIWSTTPEFNLESADGRQYGSVAFTERNIFGLGKLVSVSYQEEPSGLTRAFSFDDPGVLGSHLRVNYSATNGTSGATDGLYVGVPFYAQETRRSYGATWNRTSGVQRLYQSGVEAASVDQRRHDFEAWWGFGSRREGSVARVVASILHRDRTLGPTRAFPGAPPEFLGGSEDLRQRRVAIEGRMWQPRYIERINVNRMSTVEDFDVGRSLAVKVGYAPEFLGSTDDEGYAQVRLDAGVVNRAGFGWMRGSLSSRLRRQFREAVGQIDARWIQPLDPRWLMVFGAYGAIGEDVDRTFQVVVGGLNGLRAYPVQAVAGRRLWRLNLEQRSMFGEHYDSFVAFGTVTFLDAARAWGPGSAGSGWYTSGGVGVRIAFPRWSPAHILRADLAWPLSPTRDGQRQPVLTFGSSQGF